MNQRVSKVTKPQARTKSGSHVAGRKKKVAKKPVPRRSKSRTRQPAFTLPIFLKPAFSIANFRLAAIATSKKLPIAGYLARIRRHKIARIVRPELVLLLALLAIWFLPAIRQSQSQASLRKTPALKPLWCDTCKPAAITIPSILFYDAAINVMGFDHEQKTWPTPITGLASPKEPIANNIVIYGHSKWASKRNHFARLSQIQLGDEIRITDQHGGVHKFLVSHLALADRYNGDAMQPKTQLQVTLLTSARVNGEWLLPTKVSSATVDTVNDTKKYAVFVVTAVPQRL